MFSRNKRSSISQPSHWIPNHSGFAVLVRALCLCMLLATVQTAAYSQGATLAAQKNNARQDRRDVQVLAPGVAIKRQLQGGESHYYRITLEANQYVHLQTGSFGVDLVLTLLGPDGTRVEEIDTPQSTEVRKSILHISSSAGHYLLQVRTREKNAVAGSYGLALLRLLPVTEHNMDLIIADRASTEGWCLHEIGTQEALREAIAKFKEAIPHWHAQGDRFEEATTLMYLGEAYHKLSEYYEALEAYDQALTLWKVAADYIGEGWTFNDIGAVYNSWGEQQRALGFYLKSLQAYQRAYAADRRDRRGLGISLTAIGGVYVSLGEDHKALDYLTRALPHWRAVNDTNGEARALFQIAEVQSSVGDYPAALKNYLKALYFWRSTSDLIGQGRALTGIGRLYTRSGEYHKALDYLGEALQVRLTSGDLRGQGRTMTDLGVVYSLLSDHKKAFDFYGGALLLHRAVRDREGEANTLYQSARSERDLGHLVEARDKVEQALKIIEQVRADIADQELRASYFATVRNYYEFYVDLLMQLHHANPSAGFDAAAIQASERARARNLIETLAAAGLDIHEGVDSQLVERERSLQRQLNAKADYQMRLLRKKPSEEQIAAVAREIDELTNEYRDVMAQLKASSPRYAGLTQPAPINLKEIQADILDPDSMLLEYSLGDERSFLWLVDQTSIKSFQLPKRAEIEAAALRFYRLLTARNIYQNGETTAQRGKRLAQADAEYPEAAFELSRMLLGPVVSQLSEKRLVIVTEGVLQYVPFAALPVTNDEGRRMKNEVTNKSLNSSSLILQPLAVDHEIVNLPSASTLAVLRRELSGRSLAPKAVAVIADPVFAGDDLRVNRVARRKSRGYHTKAASQTMEDVQRSAIEVGAVDARFRIPRLLFSRAEALGILSLVPIEARKQALDFDANKATATSPELRNYHIVHFATHALLNNSHPELSGIVLSLVDENARPQDGFLRLHEIYNMKLSADLVVLSACQTGLGKEIRGEGMIGLTRGFMYAGVPRVVASLWKIDDRATAEFMKALYEAMLGEKQLRPAAALRAAQIEMWKKGNWSAPYYWAAFTVQGEWR